MNLFLDELVADGPSMVPVGRALSIEWLRVMHKRGAERARRMPTQCHPLGGKEVVTNGA